jgi:hypothetical protein
MSSYTIVPAESFHDTDAARERREIRRSVSRLKLSNSEKAVLQFLVNVWFVHRGKGAIHPGREAIAKRANVSVRTVQTYLGKFRDLGFILATGYAKGGRYATRYTVSLDAIQDAASTPVKSVPGDLVPVPTERANRTDFTPKPSKICSRSIEKAKAAPSPMSRRRRKAEVIRPSEFSVWRGTAQAAFLGWVSRQEDLRPDQELILRIIGQNLCPDHGRTLVSNRFLAKASGLTRRETDRVLAELISEKIIGVTAESRVRRKIYSGVKMHEILEQAPGMPF